MSFPQPASFAEDEQTWYVGQLSEALAAGHRQLNLAVCGGNTRDFNALTGQVTTLRDLQRQVEANECLGGKLLLLMHGYYGIPLHPRHRTEWQRGIESAVEGWFEPP